MTASTKMLYELVDLTIKQGLTDVNLQKIIEASKQHPNQTSVGPLFNLPTNIEYILKRFINACMATDPQIRQNSGKALSKWVNKCYQSEIQAGINVQKLVKFVLESSNYKKGGNRKSQQDAFAAGRCIVVKSLSNIFKNNSAIFQSITQVIKQYPHLQQQGIEACHLISDNKLLKLKFMSSISASTTSAVYLHKLLSLAKDTKSANTFSLKNNFEQILSLEIEQYPKQSILLHNIGKYLHLLTDSPSQFFLPFANKYLDSETEQQVNVHEIYCMLTVLKGFLKHNTITLANYNQYFEKRMISVWLQQFRVLNKKMKQQAKSIQIKFEENNAELAEKVIIDMHEEGVYLDNVSMKHPLGKLYQWVNVERFWKYLYGLCLEVEEKENMREIRENQQRQKQQQKMDQKNKNQKSKPTKNNKSKQNKPQPVPVPQPQLQQQQYQQQQSLTFYNQLQFFIKLHFRQLPDSNLCETIILLLNNYHKNEKRKQLLYLCINLFDSICRINRENKKQQNINNSQGNDEKTEGKIRNEEKGKGNKNDKDTKNRKRLNKKMLVILNTIKLEDIKMLTEEQRQIFKDCINWVKKNTIKIRKDEGYHASKQQINFFNFYSCLLCFCLIYPDQIETCQELQLVHSDFLSLHTVPQGKPKKKVKRSDQTPSQQNPPNKPIHVLTDIFISLMTKPPSFLRKSMHYLYQDIIPKLDSDDLTSLLTVITTPDAQFIEQI